jgi:hypothetical protein
MVSSPDVVKNLYCFSPDGGCTVPYRGGFRLNWFPHLEFFMDKRILVVDDNAPIRGLVRTFIESRPGLEICGEATDGLEGIE